MRHLSSGLYSMPVTASGETVVPWRGHLGWDEDFPEYVPGPRASSGEAEFISDHRESRASHDLYSLDLGKCV
jgi:hypothetical protein